MNKSNSPDVKPIEDILEISKKQHLLPEIPVRLEQLVRSSLASLPQNVVLVCGVGGDPERKLPSHTAWIRRYGNEIEVGVYICPLNVMTVHLRDVRIAEKILGRAIDALVNEEGFVTHPTRCIKGHDQYGSSVRFRFPSTMSGAQILKAINCMIPNLCKRLRTTLKIVAAFRQTGHWYTVGNGLVVGNNPKNMGRMRFQAGLN